MRIQRIICLLAIGLLLATLGTLAVPQTGQARSTPVASIDIGSLFGNENEPDENEVDGNDVGARHTSSGTSLPVLIGLVVLAIAAGGYAAIRIRRLWLRLRGWGRNMRARL
jgi:hypothetical protein